MSSNKQKNTINSENIKLESIFSNNPNKDMPLNFPESWHWTWNYIDERSWRNLGKLLLSIAFQHDFLNEINPERLIKSHLEVFLDACPPKIYEKYKNQLAL